MNPTSYSTPILIVIFNRPDKVKALMAAFSKVRPTTLYVAADGPRKDRPGEKERCEEARKVAMSPDWPCEVKTLFQEKNLGCRDAFPTGVDWFFANVDEGLIFEDDDIPDPSFFRFASEMLERYRDNPSVMHINGNNFQFGHKRGDASYYFSRCVHIWGFATWKRAWQTYDIDMRDLDAYEKSKKIYALFKDRRVGAFFIRLFKYVRDKHVNTYDAQWEYAVMKSGGIAVTPNVNLVENIGFGEDSTHIVEDSTDLQHKAHDIGTITHPSSISVDMEADDFMAKKLFVKSLPRRVVGRIVRILKS